MITLIHGSDYLSSRNFFTDLKEKSSDYFYADSDNLITEELLQVLSGTSLFQKKNLIFLENLYSKKYKELSDVEKILTKYEKQSEIYIWESKEISKIATKAIKFNDQNFKLPNNIFQFLDSLKPNSSANVSMAAEALENTSEEILFYMITRQFRILNSIFDSKKNIDEVKKLLPWQRSKLERQARLFGKEKLKDIYNKIFEIEKEIKTGELSYSLRNAIDFLMIEI